MGRTRHRALAALTLALALPVVACGSDDSGQFREDYNAAVKPLSEINDDIDVAASKGDEQTNRQIAVEFDKIADTAEQTRIDLSELEPPEDAREELDELLTALEGGVEDLRAVADAARSNDPQAATKAVQDLAKSGEEITTAENELKDAVD